MSSQAYQPPASAGAAIARPTQQIVYLCADCGSKNQIQAKEPIRCRECGHRVMYKQRTTRMVQFEAR
ncbi:hypothetical protein SAICODRAFT_7644 [Saitoella complicata NRRL Y-17804]|uniref:uncharacterized protein n=1 Tax=Saitoella complicata (strain BCRC 22490 / CBS 7301 / JCM 7358 / NBRC 10748 / NRRL Y-17804) TaxID=698492 RepID=UPI000867210F|nr:uncharacterized protein SAICODRAFT_7644 [Saitoella complicata NRRL Y-17804]ODQ53047.1 hypothetical protein SAICODRAFT_7644 [Saitoella complicata NRRL Y-17804]